MSDDLYDSATDPAVQPTGASCAGRSAPSCLPGNAACTNTRQPCHGAGMHLSLVTDPTPEWIIGQDVAEGDAWLVHARAPRFTARVRHSRSLQAGEDALRLECGLCLVELRWLGVTRPPKQTDELLNRADRVLASWLERQITRASRAA